MGGVLVQYVHITLYCDSVAVDGPYSTALNTNDSTDVIEYTTSPLNTVQALCEVVVNVSNDYISEAISKSFGKFYYNYKYHNYYNIIGTFYIQNFSLVQEDGSIVVQCIYAISTDDMVQCVVVFTDIQSGYTWNTTVGHTPGTHPSMGSKVITVPRAGIYNITVYDSVGDITVLAIVYDGTVYIKDSIYYYNRLVALLHVMTHV